MKLQRGAFVLVVAVLLLGVAARSRSVNLGGTSPASASPSDAAFLGRWDLTLKAPDREYPSWLELSEEHGQLKAEMVGRWGNARPLPKVQITNGHLKFVSPKEEEDRKDDMVFAFFFLFRRNEFQVAVRYLHLWQRPRVSPPTNHFGLQLAVLFAQLEPRRIFTI